MPKASPTTSEYLTRKKIIDFKLRAAGFQGISKIVENIGGGERIRTAEWRFCRPFGNLRKS